MRFLYSTFYYLACFAIARNRPCTALYPLSIFAIARIRPLAMFAIARNQPFTSLIYE